MSEIRVDPLSGLRTIIAPGREQRSADPRDPFAEGSESLTPPELYAVRPDGGEPDTPVSAGKLFGTTRTRQPGVSGSPPSGRTA